MAPVVAIEMAARDQASPLASVLLEACSQSVRAGPCVLSKQGVADPDAPVWAIATVIWSADHRVVRIEVGVRRAERATWLTDTLEFGQVDSEPERWRSAGLVVATLVGQLPPPAAASPPRPAPRPVEARRPAPLPKAPARRRLDVVWLDAGAAAGTALEDGTWQVGGFFRASAAPLPIPAFAGASFRYAARPSAGADLDVRWLSIGGGAGFFLEPFSFPLRFEGRGELVAQQVSVGVVASGERDHAAQWWLGGRFSLDGIWMLGSRLGAFVGIEAAVFPGTDIRVRGRVVAQERSFNPGVEGGVRVRF
jgi:hypothetical protein